MYTTGLVSVSFRGLAPQQVIEAACDAGLRAIEWGADVHAPAADTQRLQAIAAAQAAAGVSCCSYGTYFRLGQTPMPQLRAHIAAARLLHTDCLRVWCGVRGSAQYAGAELDALLEDCRLAAHIAQEEGVRLCLECHPGTLTDTSAGALQALAAASSPALRMYWQPDPQRTAQQNAAYAAAVAPFVEHVHVFHWSTAGRHPLAEGLSDWRQYLAALGGSHRLLLEFMPDDAPESLPREAQALRRLIADMG